MPLTRDTCAVKLAQDVTVLCASATAFKEIFSESWQFNHCQCQRPARPSDNGTSSHTPYAFSSVSPFDTVRVSQVVALCPLLVVEEHDHRGDEVHDLPGGQQVHVCTAVTTPVSISVRLSQGEHHKTPKTNYTITSEGTFVMSVQCFTHLSVNLIHLGDFLSTVNQLKI